MATTIDALIVTLGLDTKNFTDGQKKAAKAILETRETVKDSSVAMAGALRRVGLEFTGLFFGIRGIADIIGMFRDLSAELWHLGINARNLGIATAELRDWQEVAELAGGKAEDATNAVNGLQQAIFNFRFKGQVSDQIEGLQRLGINPIDVKTGGLKDITTLLFQASGALQNRIKDQATRFQYAQDYLGLTGGIANAVAQGPKALQEFFDKAKSAAQITQQQTDNQAKLNESMVALKYNVEGAFAAILDQMTPALTQFTDLLNQVIVPLKFIVDTFQMSFGEKSTLHGVGEWFGSKAADVHDWWVGNSGDKTRGLRNNNPTNLKATGNQPRDAQGFAIFGSMAEGREAARVELARYASRGWNTERSIASHWTPVEDGNDVQKYVTFLSKATGKSPDAPLTPADYPALLDAMSRIESGPGAVSTPTYQQSVRGSIQRPPLPSIPANPAALGAAQGAQPTPSISAPPIAAARAAPAGVSVSIDSMTVHTQAKDAGAIAGAMAAAVQRKFNLYQADTGVYA